MSIIKQFGYELGVAVRKSDENMRELMEAETFGEMVRIAWRQLRDIVSGRR